MNVFRYLITHRENTFAHEVDRGEADNDRAAFVLTFTPQYVAQALCKALPVTLEEIEEYAQKNEDRLRAIAHDARACGQNAKVLD
jgi:hypothetical protein